MHRTHRILALASGNSHKLQEFGEILAPAGWEVVSIRKWVPDLADPEETEPDFRGNAELKLEHARALLRESAVRPLPRALAADDSGLAVRLLDGEPGVHSARFAERAGNGSGDAANRQELARRLREAGVVPGGSAPAAFVCAIAFMELDPDRLVEAMAECPGAVGLDERGEGGFGYDSMFFPILADRRLSDRTFAELPSATKHSLSHRGLALRALVAKLGKRR
ncbi:MAG TPA: non-canonical purine NTP pyrophosphatase [Fibrobacteria bacterium]|nr:non-canonical purine NTP pyrophosphatase [Fibrobacteria bacterium]